MNKPQISKIKYVLLVNKKIKKHPEYKEDMRVELTPKEADKPMGFRTIGDSSARIVAAWAEIEVYKEYDVDVTCGF